MGRMIIAVLRKKADLQGPAVSSHVTLLPNIVQILHVDEERLDFRWIEIVVNF